MTSPESLLHSFSKEHWKKVKVAPHHGLNTPLFSLRTEKSCGIGEFEDLKVLLPWMKTIGFNVLQLLPINASGNDPSPYNALSSIALNPVYLSLHTLPGVEEDPDLQASLQELRALNALPRVDYIQVKAKKNLFLLKYTNKMAESLKTYDFVLFLEQNAWLEPYAEFKTLKNKYQGMDWRLWPYQAREELSTLKNEVEHHKIVQFLLWKQMQGVKELADQLGLFIMGDLPILVSPDSADVWSRPDRFHLDLAAGAPPDLYNEEGQKWGFPIYRTSILEKEDFLYWKEKLKAASSIYHIYRVDHIVGLFRIWAIQTGRPPKEGHFEPLDQELWQPQGEKMLRMMLEASPMLPIGEDLGIIPDEARDTMRTLGIPGTKVIRWERDWADTMAFTPYADYPVCSLTTVSTHDSEPLRLWWKSHPDEAKSFAAFKNWEFQPELSYEHLYTILKDSHETPSLFHINLLQEYLSLFPDLTWKDPSLERINIPGIVSPHNWSYKYHNSLEEIVNHEGLRQALISMAKT